MSISSFPMLIWAPPGLVTSAARALGAWCLVACCISGGLACQPSAETETRSFERAEAAYRSGHYHRALDGYEQVLRRHPSSPLAKIASTRIRCVNREVRGMLGRKDTPSPFYRGEPRRDGGDHGDKSSPVKREQDPPAAPASL